MFRTIFVLDIYNSVVVHAKRGERDSYEPIKSRIVDSANPLEIIDSLQPSEVYVADLNRLQERGDNLSVIRDISARTQTMCDIGISSGADLLKDCGTSTRIIGTETAPFELMCNTPSVSVSIDIFKGSILAKDSNTPCNVLELVRVLNECNILDIIVLDMDRVGTSTGFDSNLLCEIVDESKHPVLLGGGISDEGDLDVLEGIGIKGALVATAIHNGKVAPNRYRQA